MSYLLETVDKLYTKLDAIDFAKPRLLRGHCAADSEPDKTCFNVDNVKLKSNKNAADTVIFNALLDNLPENRILNQRANLFHNFTIASFAIGGWNKNIISIYNETIIEALKYSKRIKSCRDYVLIDAINRMENEVKEQTYSDIECIGITFIYCPLIKFENGKYTTVVWDKEAIKLFTNDSKCGAIRSGDGVYAIEFRS